MFGCQIISFAPFVGGGELLLETISCFVVIFGICDLFSKIWVKSNLELLLLPVWDDNFLVEVDDHFGPFSLHFYVCSKVFSDLWFDFKLERRNAHHWILTGHRMQLCSPKAMKCTFWICFWLQLSGPKYHTFINLINVFRDLFPKLLCEFLINFMFVNYGLFWLV